MDIKGVLTTEGIHTTARGSTITIHMQIDIHGTVDFSCV